jgi:hypothetical protein
MTLVNNTISGGSRWGIVLEISSTAYVADNVITDHADSGIVVAGTDKVHIWNNTILDNGRAAVSLLQDKRRATDMTVYGHDPRRPQPDPTMPWIVRDVTLGNNIYGARDGAEAVFEVQSWDKAFHGSEMVRYSNGNVFAQAAPGNPATVVPWAKKGTWANEFKSLADYVAATGNDRASLAHIGLPVVHGSLTPVDTIADRAGAVAQPLPAAVAAKIDRAAGTKHLGAWQ